MFAIPGFSIGNLVVEAPKEQLKKRKHEEKSAVATTAITTTTTTTSSFSSTLTKPTNTTAAILTPSPSTSNAPFSKKFKKDTFEKRAPSEPKLGWGWIPEPVPLKERASWNRSTKEIRKAKAEEEKQKKEQAILDKKQLVSSIDGPSSAVELLLKGSVDMTDIASLGGNKKAKKDQDVAMEDVSAAGEPKTKKRNKRLERKIKRAAYIVAMEANNRDVEDGTTAEDTKEGSETAAEGDEEAMETKETKETREAPAKPTAAPINPAVAKLTNKEKRLLKQLQKKQAAEGVDVAAVKPQQQHLNPSNKRLTGQSESDQKTLSELQAATAAAEESILADFMPKKSKKAEKAEKKAAAAAAVSAVEEKKTAEKPMAVEKPKENKDKALSKKTQQLNKEREKLLEALSRTNNALEELQKSLGDGDDDEAPMAKADVKAALQGKKAKSADNTKKAEAKKAPAAPAATPAAPPAKPVKLTKLQEQMKKTLAGGKFRFLNEQLYTTTGEEAFELFQSKPELFDEYHEGFRSQVESWPQNPVDIFVAQLRPMPKDTVIADLGCGDAQIARDLPKHHVLSFDLVAKNERVTACDIAHLPLEDASVDVAIFCLSLMGTDFLRFLKEAHRVLKPNGQLKISEVISRFTDVDAFVEALKSIGFELKDSDSSNKMFIMFDFVKPDPKLAHLNKKKKTKKGKKAVQEEEERNEAMDVDELDGGSLLKPCIYKKR